MGGEILRQKKGGRNIFGGSLFLILKTLEPYILSKERRELRLLLAAHAGGVLSSLGRQSLW